MNHRALALLVVSIAACSDSSVTNPVKSPPQKPHLLENEGVQPTVSTTDDYAIPTYPVPYQNAPQSYCFSQLSAANRRITIDQQQTLLWNDNNHMPRKQVVTGRVKVFHRWWTGQYAGQEVQCIKLDSVVMIGTSWEYSFKRLPNNASWDKWWNYCYGNSNCASFPAKIYVSAVFQFGRNCQIDRPDFAYTQPIKLGGLPAPGPLTDPYAHTWTYEIYAWKPGQGPYSGGWWTAINYGGNNWTSEGTPGSLDLCARWWDPNTANYFGQLAGPATWALL